MKSTYPPAHPKKTHHIADISFSKDFILCACGWRATVDEYNRHRLDGNRKKAS